MKNREVQNRGHRAARTVRPRVSRGAADKGTRTVARSSESPESSLENTNRFQRARVARDGASEKRVSLLPCKDAPGRGSRSRSFAIYQDWSRRRWQCRRRERLRVGRRALLPPRLFHL